MSLGVFGIVALGVPLTASLITLDAVSGLSKCTQCGFKHPDRGLVEKHARKHVVRQVESQRRMHNRPPSVYGETDIYRELFG